ncbi:MAG TPA: peptidoglycan-binding domain-containing protein, partial [bacterium]|nr:peptidoglycan-binding domain-containing protein [bacterium]
TRAGGLTLAGQAFALARIPVRADATDDAVRQFRAMRPMDLVLGAIENQAKVTLPTPRTAPLSSEEWSWLFQPMRKGIHRRRGDAPLVDATGRPIPNMYQSLNGSDPVKPGDILIAGDQYAILEEDDGDQWLSEGDPIVHTIHGQVRRGKISELSGTTIDVFRVRSFLELRGDLRRAGYGGTERTSVNLGPELMKGIRDFQRDRHLPLTAVPDSTTLAALQQTLAKLGPPAGASPPSPSDSTSAHAAPR